MILTRDDTGGKGTWAKVYIGGFEFSASMCCPSCAHISSLSAYTIGGDGVMMPRVLCPYCPFGEWCPLEEWPPT